MSPHCNLIPVVILSLFCGSLPAGGAEPVPAKTRQSASPAHSFGQPAAAPSSGSAIAAPKDTAAASDPFRDAPLGQFEFEYGSVQESYERSQPPWHVERAGLAPDQLLVVRFDNKGDGSRLIFPVQIPRGGQPELFEVVQVQRGGRQVVVRERVEARCLWLGNMPQAHRLSLRRWSSWPGRASSTT